MNKERFQELMVNPGKMENEDIVQLQQLIHDYPYFHNAHLLLLYGLNFQNTDRFNDQLKTSSLYLSSRTQLVKALKSGWPHEEVTSFSIEKKDESVPLKTVEIVVNTAITEKQPDIEVVQKELEIETEAVKENIQVTFEPVSRNSTEISFEDNFSFSLEDTQPIESSEKREAETSEKQELSPDLLELDLLSNMEDNQTVDLIDHFLKVNPRIVPKLDLEDTRGDISVPALEENDEIITETLADIYVQQGHYKKAKVAYQKLILKFPEKSTYFASRIKEIEKRSK